MAIPLTGYAAELESLTLEDGFERIERNVPLEQMNQAVNGMLFRISLAEIPNCITERELLLCQARAQVLGELRGLFAVMLDQRQDDVLRRARMQQ